MTKCMMNEAAMAVIREGFRQGGITNKLWFSLKLKDKNKILMVYKGIFKPFAIINNIFAGNKRNIL